MRFSFRSRFGQAQQKAARFIPVTAFRFVERTVTLLLRVAMIVMLMANSELPAPESYGLSERAVPAHVRQPHCITPRPQLIPGLGRFFLAVAPPSHRRTGYLNSY